MIDIKTLRIGSHLSHNGRRVRVALVREDGCICECKDNGQDVIVGLGVEKQPIPITPELLKELGFVQKRMDYPYGKPDIWYVDPESAKLMENELVVPIVSIWPMEKFGFADWWKIRVLVGDRPMYEGEYVCRYLHEAESFLGLHNIELIKE